MPKLSTVQNILNEPSPSDLHGRLKFTTEQFVDLADIEGRTVLDIGCGYGWFELWAAKTGVKQITGLDKTSQDLKTGRENIRLPQVVFKEGDATDLPIETDSCDTVVAWEVIEHVHAGTEPKMFAEVKRVLRPSGCFYFSTPNRTLRSILGDPTYWIIRHRHYEFTYFAQLASLSGFRVAKHTVKGGFIEIVDMWNLYLAKWIFRRDRFFKPSSLAWTDYDYGRERGFNTLFVKAVKV